MSKRSRGPQRPAQRRPGTRPPTSRPAAARANPAAATRSLPSVDADLDTSLTLGAAPVPTSLPTPEPGRPSHVRVRAKPGSLLAARAATEYVYVARDLRKILLVAVGLLAILLALWVVLVVMGLSPLY